MGRLTTRTRRSVFGRSLLVFAFLLAGPALGFGLLGWNSVQRDHTFRVHEMRTDAQEAVSRRVDSIARLLTTLRDRESTRHYYEFQDSHYPVDTQYAQYAFRPSPLAQTADPRVLGWFQWELYGAGRTYGKPEVWPRSAHAFRNALDESYAADLRFRLERAPKEGHLAPGRGSQAVTYPLRVVAANEERGKIQEELLDLERQGRTNASEQRHQQNYLQNFEARMESATVTVRVTPYRYLARRASLPGPTLIAWRLVWIPATHAAQRDVRRDRYLIQGYALDLSRLLPRVGEREGSAEMATLADLHPEDAGAWLRESLLDHLDADVAGLTTGRLGPGQRPPAGVETDPALVLVSRVVPHLERRTWRDAVRRFLLLTGALVGVLITGFVVLYRSFHSEMKLVQRKEDFMAAISHELKTPLTGIRMYADMLKEGWVANPEAAENYATRILAESERLGHLVNQVLDLTALERGVAQFRGQKGDLGATVKDAVSWMEARAKDAHTALTVEIEPDLPPITLDPQLVRPLVLNLIDNAIKYSAKSDTKQVRVRVRRDGERLVLSVADRGVGIDPKTRKRLFEPFHRAEGELTRDAPGLGIGLALVKRYADAHRARVIVDSEPGRGTTISVRFPL